MVLVQGRALEHLHPDNLSARFTATWTMAFAHLLKGEARTWLLRDVLPAAAAAVAAQNAAKAQSAIARYKDLIRQKVEQKQREVDDLRNKQ